MTHQTTYTINTMHNIIALLNTQPFHTQSIAGFSSHVVKNTQPLEEAIVALGVPLTQWRKYRNAQNEVDITLFLQDTFATDNDVDAFITVTYNDDLDLYMLLTNENATRIELPLQPNHYVYLYRFMSKSYVAQEKNLEWTTREKTATDTIPTQW